MQFPDDYDGKMLTAMAAAGVDMTAVLAVDFFLVFADHRDANAALMQWRQIGEGDTATAELHLDDDTGKWELIVCINMVVNYQAIVDQELVLNTFAAEFGGATDGWGVMQH